MMKVVSYFLLHKSNDYLSTTLRQLLDEMSTSRSDLKKLAKILVAADPPKGSLFYSCFIDLPIKVTPQARLSRIFSKKLVMMRMTRTNRNVDRNPPPNHQISRAVLALFSLIVSSSCYITCSYSHTKFSSIHSLHYNS